LTGEILQSLGYEDLEVLELLQKRSTLVGEIEASAVFQSAFEPCVTTLQQLEDCAAKPNLLVLGLTKFSGSAAMDEAVLKETQEELARGLEQGATISRRFPLLQGEKIRMIDDYWVSGVNDSCTVNTKLDLHVIDTFVAAAKAYFEQMHACGKDTSLQAKTYDLKSAYRQIPIRDDHLKYGYFCIFNCEKGAVEIYRSRTLPFGAAHSIYNSCVWQESGIQDMMILRLQTAGPKTVNSQAVTEWLVFSDAAFDKETKEGGLGAVLVSANGD
jgi:hypothetical protein